MSCTPRHGRPPCSPCAALGLVFGLALTAAMSLPMIGSMIGVAIDEPVCAAAPGPIVGGDDDPEIAEDMLHGLWMRYETRGEGDPLRFWYFHGDGKGLYRYGKVGLANTHGFDYAIEGAELFLRFRKTGAEHVIEVELDHDDRGIWLRLRDDPYEPGARYRKVESELDAPDHSDAAGIGDRIWIDWREFATGGGEFHMYQFARTAIDGRGVGWFHRGDFDEWSTESLTYRIDGDRLELFFDIREEPNSTEFRLLDGAHGRELLLESDPRDYWATHRYRDGGRSFGAGELGPVLAPPSWPERP